MNFTSFFSALAQIRSISDIVYPIVNIILVIYYFANFSKKEFLSKKSFIVINGIFLVSLIIDFVIRLGFFFILRETSFLLFIHPINIILFTLILINPIRIHKIEKYLKAKSKGNCNNKSKNTDVK